MEANGDSCLKDRIIVTASKGNMGWVWLDCQMQLHYSLTRVSEAFSPMAEKVNGHFKPDMCQAVSWCGVYGETVRLKACERHRHKQRPYESSADRHWMHAPRLDFSAAVRSLQHVAFSAYWRHLNATTQTGSPVLFSNLQPAPSTSTGIRIIHCFLTPITRMDSIMPLAIPSPTPIIQPARLPDESGSPSHRTPPLILMLRITNSSR